MLRQSLQSFLARAKEAVRNHAASKEPLTFVIGNESADLDSFTSSLLYAYLWSSLAPSKQVSSLNIPVLNIPRGDIRLRPEFETVLNHVDLSESNIVTLDDLPNANEMLERLSPESTQWILVDHNALQGRLGKLYENRVVGVIDHHAEEHKVPNDTGSYPRILQKCGSCTSLVTQYFMPMWGSRLSPKSTTTPTDKLPVHSQTDVPSEADANTQQWSSQAAKLAIASILIDTRNLTSKDKVTEIDVQAVDFLEAKINTGLQSPEPFDRKAFFDELDAAKRNIDGFSIDDILRKDYKEWEESGRTVGISSVVKNISFLAEKASKEVQGSDQIADFVNLVGKFAEARNLGICVVMTASVNRDGEFQRELLVNVIHPECKTFLEKFANESGEEFGLEVHEQSRVEVQGSAEERPSWRLWNQKNLAASRKEVGPSIRHAME